MTIADAVDAPQDASAIEFIGQDLSRPECVLTTRSGDIFVSDKRGGVSTFRVGGPSRLIEGKGHPDNFITNGFALLPDRSFLLANLGEDGGVWHLTQDGVLAPRIMKTDLGPLPTTNFVGIDKAGRTWISVSAVAVPRFKSMRKGACDGFIAVDTGDGRGARVVADGIDWSNEAIVDPSGQWLYVNETLGRCTSRFPIRADGSLGSRELVAEYGTGTYPDGLTFDAHGGFWIVSVVSNRVIHVDADGNQRILIEDSSSEIIDRAEAAYRADTFGAEEINSGKIFALRNVSSIALGGPDLRDVYLGSLFGDHIGYYRSNVAGAPPVHWDF